MSAGVVIAALVVAVPAVAWTVWPLFRRRTDARGWLAVPQDERETLLERKRAALAALRELEFEREAGHLSETDFAELRARYESEAAVVIEALDRVRPARPAATPAARAAVASRGWRHPAALAAGAVALLVFGVALGVGIVRYTEPDQTAAMPAPGARPLAGMAPPGGETSDAGPRTVTPEIMRGMLDAARAALFAGRYGEAIAAYQAVLKRDPKNVDAMTHLALIVAIGGHADSALETFEKVLAIDPKYPPALLYRGEVLLEAKNDRAGAIASWEKFLAVAPPGEDHQRVRKMISDARAGVSGTR